jgi:HD-GYP domain-containing protein (c-di-GMP phosphodiesterase class II)
MSDSVKPGRNNDPQTAEEIDQNEIEELEELEEVESLETSERIFRDLIKEYSIQCWTMNYIKSPLPLLLLDGNLQIVWANLKFQDLYGDYKNYVGHHITRFYSDSFDEERRTDLLLHTRSQEKTYSWRGQVEKKGRDELAVLSNLLILPIFKSPELLKDPIAYMLILDDVSEEHRKLLRDTFTSLLEASRLKDNDTGNHIQRVNTYSKHITEMLMGRPNYSEIDREFLENIGFLAAMHDVGKIGTSDNILNKEGPLDEWEWEIMKEHTINGAFILSTYPNAMAKEIALFHHERWDGTGYPYGVSETMIPLSARIVAVADVYDALRMKRPYKEPFSHERSVEIMTTEEKDHFDPDLMSYFMEIHENFRETYERLKD